MTLDQNLKEEWQLGAVQRLIAGQGVLLTVVAMVVWLSIAFVVATVLLQFSSEFALTT